MLIGQTNDVTFKVNVMGTSVEPKVRLVFSTSPEISFPAEKVGDEWKAAVTIPHTVMPGSYSMKVEVLLNNRYFAPLTKVIELFDVNQVAAPADPAELPPAPAETPASAVEPEIDFVAAMEDAPEAVTSPQQEAETQSSDLVQPKVERIIKLDEVTPPPVKKKIVLPKDFFKLEHVPSSPVKLDYQPIIMKQPVHTALDRPLAVQEVKRVKKKKLVEIKTELPVRLIKGGIVIE